MAIPLDKLIERLIRSGLLAEEDLRAFVQQSRAQDSETLAKALVKARKLTAHQVQQIYSGKGDGLLLGNYEILDKIGQGGMGAVYKARHRRMGREVAIKVVSPDVVKTSELLQRFHREVHAAAKLNHPNVVAAYDADEVKGTHFLVLEFVEGADLSAKVKKNGPFSVDQAIDLTIQAARGLQYAHEQGVIHRDIKPGNLLLDKTGVVKILDMGLARIESSGDVSQAELTGTGAVMGTIDYMAPEQAVSTRDADARSDIYSLGISLHYFLSGSPVYRGDSLMARLVAHRESPIPSLCNLRSDVPQALDDIFRKMIAKKPQDRYQSMAAVIADLESCKRGESPSRSVSVGPTEDSKLSSFLRSLSQESGRPQFHTDVTSAQKGATRVSTAEDEIAPAPTIIGTTADLPTDPQTHIKTAPKKKPLKAQSSGVAPAAQKSATPNRKLISISVSALALIGLLAGVFLRFETPEGTIVLEIDQPELVGAEVSVDGVNKLTIRTNGDTDPITVSADGRTHTLQVTKGGFRTFTREFTVTARNSSTIRVTLEPSPRPDESSPDQKVSRAVEYFLNQSPHGCTVSVGVLNKEEVLTDFSDYSRRGQPVFGIVIHDTSRFDNELRAHLLAIPTIASLKIFDTGYAPELKEAVRRLQNLQELGLSGPSIDDSWFETLSGKSGLTRLHLVVDEGKVSTAGWQCLRRLPALNSLSVSGPGITDEMFRALSGYTKKLSFVSHDDIPNVTPDGFKVLATLPALHAFDLRGQSQLTDQHLTFLSDCSALTSLILLDNKNLSNELGMTIARCQKLQHLSLAGSSFSEAIVSHLRGLRELDYLELAISEVTDKVIPGIAEIPKLSRSGNVGIYGSKLTEDGFRRLVTAIPGSTVHVTTEGPQGESWVYRPNDAGDQTALRADASGWISLFDGTSTAGWQTLGSFRVEEGLLVAGGAGENAISKDQYDNFEFETEWRVGLYGNSGIYYRARASGANTYGNEYELIDESTVNLTPDYRTGALLSLIPPSADATRPTGEWNRTRIICSGTRIEHWLNDQLVVTYDTQSEDFQNSLAELRRTKAASGEIAEIPEPRSRGPIVLQAFTGDVAYRNIRVRPIVDVISRPGLRFDGKSYVQAPNFRMQPDTPFTLEAVVTLESINSDEGYCIIANIAQVGSIGYFSNEPGMGIWTSNILWNGVQVTTGEWNFRPLSESTGRTVHIAMTSESGKLELFLQGRRYSELRTFDIHPDTRLANGLMLGTQGIRNGHIMGGLIGTIHNLKLSRGRIYESDFSPPTSFTADASTEVLYDFSQGHGDVLKDLSGNGHDGNIVQATWVPLTATGDR